LRAFREFRKRLQAPLVAVEFSQDGSTFDLMADDAEIVLRVSGGAPLWQKERLLNLAIQALPDSCDTVAWIDGDVVLARDDWPSAARAALDESRIVQLFQRVYFLEQDELPLEAGPRHGTTELESIVCGLSAGTIPDEVFNYPAISQRFRCSPGFAWAARRELLERHGLYDALILGGGDKAILSAACGQAPALVRTQSMSPAQARHYLRWAEAFAGDVGGRTGYIEGEAFHIWHGSIESRDYAGRYANFDRFGFDPLRDLTLTPSGAWGWGSSKPALQQWARDYFEGRKR